jgi:hypothetical protein
METRSRPVSTSEINAHEEARMMDDTTQQDYLARLVGGILYETREDAERADRGYVLNEYDLVRRYGGPEEGGWWYTEWNPTMVSVELHPSIGWEDASEVRDDLQAFADIENRQALGAHSRGEGTVWAVEQHGPQHRPDVTPHYE